MLNSGESVRLLEVFIGNSTGVIGSSALGLLLGGCFLLLTGGITWEIPVSCIAAFTVWMTCFGGEGFATFTIASRTGEGLTSAATFTKSRRCSILYGFF